MKVLNQHKKCFERTDENGFLILSAFSIPKILRDELRWKKASLYFFLIISYFFVVDEESRKLEQKAIVIEVLQPWNPKLTQGEFGQLLWSTLSTKKPNGYCFLVATAEACERLSLATAFWSLLHHRQSIVLLTLLSIIVILFSLPSAEQGKKRSYVEALLGGESSPPRRLLSRRERPSSYLEALMGGTTLRLRGGGPSSTNSPNRTPDTSRSEASPTLPGCDEERSRAAPGRGNVADRGSGTVPPGSATTKEGSVLKSSELNGDVGASNEKIGDKPGTDPATKNGEGFKKNGLDEIAVKPEEKVATKPYSDPIEDGVLGSESNTLDDDFHDLTLGENKAIEPIGYVCIDCLGVCIDCLVDRDR